MSELRQIPNVGQQTEQDLIAMGYTTLESLKGKKKSVLSEVLKLTVANCIFIGQWNIL